MVNLPPVNGCSVADQLDHAVRARHGRHSRTVDGRPVGATVFHHGRSIGLPCVNLDTLAHIQVDTAVRARRRIARTMPLDPVRGEHASRPHHRANNDLRHTTQAKVRRHGTCREADGQHQQIERSAQQLHDDDHPRGQPP